MGIPTSLVSVRQWVAWRFETRDDGKPTKVPVNPHTGGPASVTDPKTWGTFEEAKRRGGDKIGFVFTGSDPFVAVDLDGCRNPDTGEIAAWAQEIVADLSSYTEISPSGTGVHVLLRGALPGRGRKRTLEHNRISEKQPALEVYSQGRFFTVTGQHLDNTPSDAEDRQSALQTLYSKYFGDPDSLEPDPILLSPLPSPVLPLRLGDRLKELVLKGWSEGCGLPSASELDFAVATEMLRNGHTPAEVVWVFEHPTFGFSRGKHRRPDYIQRTIAAAQMAARTTSTSTSDLHGYTVAELRTMVLEDERTVVDRLIFDKSITLVAGPPKIGKTLWVMQLMASLATGRPFLDEFAVDRPGVSLHMTAELPSRRYRDRWEKFFAILYAGAESQIVVCSEKAVDLERDFDRICYLIDQRKPRLIVVDPLVRYHRRKENESDDMARALEQIDRILAKYGIAVLIVHHAKKSQMGGWEDPFEAIRGTGVLRSHPNVNVVLLPSKQEIEDDESISHVKMYVESNFDEPMRPMRLIRGEHGLFERDSTKKTEFGQALLEILRSVSKHELPRAILVKRLSEAYGMPKALTEKRLDSPVLPAGVRVELREGVKWYIVGEAA